MVWDPLVRLIHWSVAGAVLLNGVFTDPQNRIFTSGWDTPRSG